MQVSRSRTGVRSNSALVCTLRTLTFHKVCEPVTAKQSFGGQGDTGLPTRFLLSATALSKNKEAEGCEHMHSGEEPVGLCDTGLPAPLES